MAATREGWTWTAAMMMGRTRTAMRALARSDLIVLFGLDLPMAADLGRDTCREYHAGHRVAFRLSLL